MVKVPVLSTEGKKISEVELSFQFEEPVRSDLIKRAVLAVRSHNYQPYGTDPLAGTRQGKATSKRRRKYGSTYNIGISRVKRKRLWRRGGRFGWVAAFIASAVKGKKAFPPKAEKIIVEKINKKEKRKAIRSAIAATAFKELIEKNHKVAAIKSFPIVIENKFEAAKKTSEVFKVLEVLGLKEELNRTKQKKVRAGKGTARGRKYRRKTGPLIVVGKDCALLNRGKNIAGVDVVNVHSLNAELLAPSAEPSRLTIWTQSAMEALAKERLFT